jgi:hypothetical protein
MRLHAGSAMPDAPSSWLLYAFLAAALVNVFGVK